jgi:hypothetical protein
VLGDSTCAVSRPSQNLSKESLSAVDDTTYFRLHWQIRRPLYYGFTALSANAEMLGREFSYAC